MTKKSDAADAAAEDVAAQTPCEECGGTAAPSASGIVLKGGHFYGCSQFVEKASA